MTESNLIPFDKLTEEEQRKIRSKGGKASVVAQRKKRDLKRRIAATLELLSSNAIRDLKNQIANEEDPMQKTILEDQISVLKEGGIEMLTQARILLNPLSKDETKQRAVEFLTEHEHGKAVQKVESEVTNSPFVLSIENKNGDITKVLK